MRPPVAALLLVLLMIAFWPALPGAAAQAPPAPEPLEGRFQVRQAMGGDTGVYEIQEARDIGSGFEAIGAPEELLRFTWLAPRDVPTPTHAAQPVFAVRMEHGGWTRDATDRTDYAAENRTWDEMTFVDAKGGTHGRQSITGSSGDGSVRDTHLMGRWGEVPCGIVTNAHAGMELDEPLVWPDDCHIAGISLRGPFTAVARMRLGPFDTVVFHEPRDHGDGDRWVWYAQEVAMPLAMVLQRDDHPRLFDVVRLTRFQAGDETLSWGSDSTPSGPWPAAARWSPGPLPEAAGDDAPWGLAAVLTTLAEHAELEGARAWLDERPDAWLRVADPMLVQSDGDGNVVGGWYTLDFEAHGERLWISIGRERIVFTDPIDAVYAAAIAAQCLLAAQDPACLDPQHSPATNGYHDTVHWDTRACDGCDGWDPALESAALPTLEELHRRALALGVASIDTPLLAWGYSQECDDWDGCDAGWVTRMYGHYENGEGLASSLEWGVDRRAVTEDAPSGEVPAVATGEYHMMIVGRWVPAPGAEPTRTTPPVLGVAPSKQIMEMLRETGLMERGALADAPRHLETATGPGRDDSGAQANAGPAGAVRGAPWPGDAAILGFRAAGAAVAGVGLLGLLALLVVKGWVFGGLFSRIDRHKVLEHPLRSQIHDIIIERPGIHLGALSRAVDRSSGVVRHHLGMLIETGLVQKHTGSGATTFVATGAAERGVAAASPVLTSLTARRVLLAVLREPGTSPGAIAKQLSLAPGTVSHHLRRLEAAGMLARTRRGTRVALLPSLMGTQAVHGLGLMP